MSLQDDLRPYLYLTQAGLVMLTAAVTGFYAGGWADDRWGTGPWLSSTGAFLGVATGLYEIFRQVRKLR